MRTKTWKVFIEVDRSIVEVCILKANSKEDAAQEILKKYSFVRCLGPVTCASKSFETWLEELHEKKNKRQIFMLISALLFFTGTLTGVIIGTFVYH
jgi:hypothetical protein